MSEQDVLMDGCEEGPSDCAGDDPSSFVHALFDPNEQPSLFPPDEGGDTSAIDSDDPIWEQYPNVHRNQPYVEGEKDESRVHIDMVDEQHVKEIINEAINAPFTESIEHPSPSGPVNGASSASDKLDADIDRPPSAASTVSTEPFPDYYESCETNPPPIVDPAHEAAYNYAISKVVEEMRKYNDHRVIASLDTIEHSINYDNNHAPARPSTTMLHEILHCCRHSHHDHFCPEQEVRKFSVLERLNEVLNQETDLEPNYLRRFNALTNITLEIEFIIFRSKDFPHNPLSIISDEELDAVCYFAAEIVKSFSRLGGFFFSQLDVARRTHSELAKVTWDLRDEHPRVQWVYITEIVPAPQDYLKREKPFIHDFLTCFFEFYETVLYDNFHTMYSQFMVEHYPDVSVKLREGSYLLNTISKILLQAINNYSLLVEINTAIGEQIIRPVWESLTNGPIDWTEWVEQHRLIARGFVRDTVHESLLASETANPHYNLSHHSPESFDAGVEVEHIEDIDDHNDNHDTDYVQSEQGFETQHAHGYHAQSHQEEHAEQSTYGYNTQQQFQALHAPTFYSVGYDAQTQEAHDREWYFVQNHHHGAHYAHSNFF